VILLLRALQDALDPKGRPGARLSRADALAKLESILGSWQRDEDLTALRNELGVAPQGGRPKARRKLSQVGGEMQIIDRLLGVALSGVDCGTYGRAADALGDVDEKKIERAWREWGSLRASDLRALCSIWPDQEENITAALARLPSLPD
jgi:hypothetical protein